MTIVNFRNERGDYELPGHDPVPGYSRVAAMKAKQGLETFKLKRAVATCQWAAANGDDNWLHADSYHLVREIDNADTRKADAGTCVARACELLTSDGLAPKDAAVEAVTEQQHRVAAWNEWAEASSYQRRKQGLRKPTRINFTPDLDYVVACVEGFVQTIHDIDFTIFAAEQTVFTPGLFAGTADIFGRFGNGPLQCWDVKTGAKIYPDMSLQLGAYSNAELWVTSPDGLNIELHPAPEIDRRNGGIFHVTEHGTDAYPMDLTGAWEAFTGLIAVREHEAVCKAITLDPIRVAPVRDDLDLTHDERCDWVVDRTRSLSADADTLADLKRRWPADVAFKPPWTSEQLDQVTAIVSTVAHLHNADDPRHPFGPPNPDRLNPPAEPASTPDIPVDPYPPQPVTDGTVAEPEAVAELVASHNKMHADEIGAVTRWLTEGRQARRTFGLGNPDRADLRCYHIAAAAVALATNVAVYHDNPAALPDSGHTVDQGGVVVNETDCRTIVANATGWTISPDQTTGGLLGSLTVQHAATVQQIANNFPATGQLEAK